MLNTPDIVGFVEFLKGVEKILCMSCTMASTAFEKPSLRALAARPRLSPNAAGSRLPV